MRETKSDLPPATDYQRLPLRLLNALLRPLNRLGIWRARLDEVSLLEAARKQAGLQDFGDESFLVPMRVLLDSLEQQTDLNPLGRALTRQSIIRILRNRLMAEELCKRHPEILERPMPAPVVVVGLARSGTTRLHRLLAADSRFLHLKSWETVHPVPWPDSYGAAVDPRQKNIEQALKAVLYMSPQIATVHPLGAHEVEEEVGLLQHHFSSQIFEVITPVPAFAEWLMSHEQTAAYEYMLKLMKIINWFRDDPPDKPWVMKTPQHMQDLDALMKVFPTARLVFAHRDPVKTMGSICSMAWNSVVRDGDHPDPHVIGADWFRKVDRMLHKTIDLRDSSIARGQQFDVQYADISTDWQAVMSRLYAWLDMELTDAALAGMRTWVDTNVQHKHGAHKYALENFGLDPATVEQRFGFYRKKYGIPYETRPR